MNDDLRTTALLDEATRSLDPDVPDLVRGGVARGRVLRRRRRTLTALVAAAVFGVVGAAASVALEGDRGADRGVDAATEAPAPSAPPADPAAPRRIGFDVEKGAAILESLLPEGDVRQREAWGSDGDSPARGARLLLDGGEVTMSLGEPAPDVEGGAEGQCRVIAGADCHALDDGSWLTVVAVDAENDSAQDRLLAQLSTPDGWSLQVAAGVGDDGGEPVLTGRQLTRIVTDPVWLDEQQ